MRDGDAEGDRERSAHRERKAPCEARGHDRGEQAEDERRAPVPRAHDGPHVEGDLGEHRDDAPEPPVVVVERPEGAPQRVPQQHQSPDEDVELVDLADGGDDEPDGERAPADARDQRPEGGQPVGRRQLHLRHPRRPAGAQRAHGRQRFGARWVAVNRTALAAWIGALTGYGGATSPPRLRRREPGSWSVGSAGRGAGLSLTRRIPCRSAPGGRWPWFRRGGGRTRAGGGTAPRPGPGPRRPG